MSKDGIYIKDLIEELSKEGYRLIMQGYMNRDFTNRTFNLHDSYGSAVYYDGKIQPNTIYTMSSTATKAKKWYGRDIRGSSEIVNYLNSYPAGKKGIELVVVAAMPYASILENGQGNLKRKYKVISNVKQELDLIAGKYNGSVMRITK